MPLLEVDATSPVDWLYAAEGGANLVLSYAGTACPELRGHALRLRKRKRVAGLDGAIPDKVDVEFGDKVIRPLLGPELCLDTRIVPLSSEWLRVVAESLAARNARPPKRVQEDDIDINADRGVLVRDLISGEECLSVEIKPKWGFLPPRTHLSPGTVDFKTAYCRTCMHRSLKAEFCPLDLYSKDPVRTARALQELYTSWDSSKGSINNLRFFLDGKLVKPSELPPHFDGLMRSPPNADDDPASRFASRFTPILLASPVLPRLATLQASLDPLDIEGLAIRIRDKLGLDLYRPDLTEDEVASSLGGQPTMQEWQAWLERWQDRAGSAAPSNERDETPLRDLILAYLLSATFKDCSIFFRLDYARASSDLAATPNAGHPNALEAVEIKVIDLDPKPIARMGKYARMDSEIVEHWRDTVLAGNAPSRGCANLP